MIVQTVLLFLSLLLIFYSFYWIITQQLSFFQKNKAPFVPSSAKLAKQAISYWIKVTGSDPAGCHFFEPGCGTGNITRVISQNFNFKSSQGLEKDTPVILWARFLNLFHSKKITIKKADILKENYPTHSVFYCYLLPSLLTTFYHKLKKEKVAGWVISLDFKVIGLKESFSLKRGVKTVWYYRI
jgi:hypothetical protein